VAEKDAVIGGDLTLTLDYDLQAQAEALLDGSVGAIIAMDPRSGEILAMAGAPAFNPNTFTKDWTALKNDPKHPLQNRANTEHVPAGFHFSNW